MTINQEQYPDNALVDGPLRIESLQAIHGAGYYSAGPVIILQLNLGDYGEVFTNKIPGFAEKLKNTLPTLEEHKCSEGESGGFFKRIIEGTLLGHVAEHIVIELQALAGMNVNFGKTKSTGKKGIYNVIFRFINENAGFYTARASVNLLNQILTGKEPDDIDQITGNLSYIYEKEMMSTGIAAIKEEADMRNIPVIPLQTCNLVQFGTGKYQKRIRGTVTSQTPLIGAENTRNKYLNTLMLSNAGIPAPETLKTEDIEEVVSFWKSQRKPVTLKSPARLDEASLFPGINHEDVLKEAFIRCKAHDDEVLVQEQIPGMSYRILVINNRFVAATLLQNPEVVGNGKDTIARLIEKLNKEQNRQSVKRAGLKILQPDDAMLEVLSFYGYTLDDVPEKGKKILLSHYPSAKNGALTTDVTGEVHPQNQQIAERAARISGLDVAGVNIVCPDISKPIEDTQGAVVDIIPGQDFQMYLNPWQGKRRDVAAPFLDMLFPENAPFRITVISVTGSAGKSVCAYLVNFMLEKEGYKTGLAHSDGIYIDGHRIIREDMANHHAAQLILKDPGVDCAVLETSAESIMSEGLGYDFADVGIVLNVHPQHLYLDSIHNTDDLAHAKSVVAEEVYRDGYSILNADEPLILSMRERIYSKPILFTKKTDNPEFKKHCLKGGMGAGVENNEIFLWTHGGKNCIARLSDIPLWGNGKNDILLESILAAICTAAAMDLHPERISHLLKAFKPDSSSLHGRLMTIYPNQNTVIIDKPAGPIALKNLKNKLADNKDNYEIFTDLSGNIPDDFWLHFSNVFKKENIRVNLFFSQNDFQNSGSPFIADAQNSAIIPLKNRYQKPKIFHDKMDEKSIVDTIKNQMNRNTGKNFEFRYFKNAIECIKKLETNTKTHTFLLFSWNFRYLQQLISQNLIFL
ncbi:MAG: hypothetical protein EA393_10785 [Bacteroidetes bacterium]|nr:MAG: hypothetical protein EA393_10785 [Bacteroidota bacterium]